MTIITVINLLHLRRAYAAASTRCVSQQMSAGKQRWHTEVSCPWTHSTSDWASRTHSTNPITVIITIIITDTIHTFSTHIMLFTASATRSDSRSRCLQPGTHACMHRWTIQKTMPQASSIGQSRDIKLFKNTRDRNKEKELKWLLTEIFTIITTHCQNTKLGHSWVVVKFAALSMPLLLLQRETINQLNFLHRFSPWSFKGVQSMYQTMDKPARIPQHCQWT